MVFLIIGAILAAFGIYALLIACSLIEKSMMRLAQSQNDAVAVEGAMNTLKAQAQDIDDKWQQATRLAQLGQQRLSAARAVESHILDKIQGRESDLDWEEMYEFLKDNEKSDESE